MITHTTEVITEVASQTTRSSVLTVSQQSLGVSVATRLGVEELHFSKTIVIPTLRYSTFRQQNLTMTDDTPADSTLTKSCKPLDVQTSPVFYLAKSCLILANSKLFGDNHII